jgi:hypothetical protein
MQPLLNVAQNESLYTLKTPGVEMFDKLKVQPKE